MNRVEFTYKVLNFIGWCWFFIKKPFKWFGKLNWKAKAIVIVLILTIFDKLRFLLFDLLVWLIK